MLPPARQRPLLKGAKDGDLAPEPLGRPGGPGLFHHKGLMLPAYVQHVAHDLMEDHHFTKGHAIATAIEDMKRWAATSKDPRVKAAATAALSEWERDKSGGASLAKTLAEEARGYHGRWVHGYGPKKDVHDLPGYTGDDAVPDMERALRAYMKMMAAQRAQRTEKGRRGIVHVTPGAASISEDPPMRRTPYGLVEPTPDGTGGAEGVTTQPASHLDVEAATSGIGGSDKTEDDPGVVQDVYGGDRGIPDDANAKLKSIAVRAKRKRKKVTKAGWTEAAHPRGPHGHWVAALSSMKPAEGLAHARAHVGELDQHNQDEFLGHARRLRDAAEDAGDTATSEGFRDVIRQVRGLPKPGENVDLERTLREGIRDIHNRALHSVAKRFNPDQPRGFHGRWVRLGDDLHHTNELFTRWANLDRELLPYAGNPEHPTARRIISEQMTVTKQIHHLSKHTPDNPTPGIADVVVVGSGPAGLSAAIYGATEGLDTHLIEGSSKVGGQAGLSSRIENVLGFPAGVTGAQYAQMGLQQAQRVGANVEFNSRVTGLHYDKKTGVKTLTLADGRKARSHTVILAGGVGFKKLNFPGADLDGVAYGDSTDMKSHCVSHDAVIVGGANSAGQAALDVARVARHVTIIVRGDVKSKMSSYLLQQLHSAPNVTIIEHAEIDAAVGTNRINAVRLKDGRVLPAAALGLFIGSAPSVGWAGVATDDHGYVRTNEGLEASIPGVYAAGDLRAGSVHRVITAAADGAHAIAEAHNYVAAQKAMGAPTTKALAVEDDAADRWLTAMYRLDLAHPFTGGDPAPVDHVTKSIFNPAAHPRDPLGRFTAALSALPAGGELTLPAGFRVSRDATHFNVKQPNGHVYISHRQARDAALAAFNLSAKSSHAASIGGTLRFANFDEYKRGHIKGLAHRRHGPAERGSLSRPFRRDAQAPPAPGLGPLTKAGWDEAKHPRGPGGRWIDALGHELHVGDKVRYKAREATVVGPVAAMPDRVTLDLEGGGRALADPAHINSPHMDADGAINEAQRANMRQLRELYGGMSNEELLSTYHGIDSPWMFHHQMDVMHEEAQRRGLDLRPTAQRPASGVFETTRLQDDQVNNLALRHGGVKVERAPGGHARVTAQDTSAAVYDVHPNGTVLQQDPGVARAPRPPRPAGARPPADSTREQDNALDDLAREHGGLRVTRESPIVMGGGRLYNDHLIAYATDGSNRIYRIYPNGSVHDVSDHPPLVGAQENMPKRGPIMPEDLLAIAARAEKSAMTTSQDLDGPGQAPTTVRQAGRRRCPHEGCGRPMPCPVHADESKHSSPSG